MLCMFFCICILYVLECLILLDIYILINTEQDRQVSFPILFSSQREQMGVRRRRCFKICSLLKTSARIDLSALGNSKDEGSVSLVRIYHLMQYFTVSRHVTFKFYKITYIYLSEWQGNVCWIVGNVFNSFAYPFALTSIVNCRPKYLMTYSTSYKQHQHYFIYLFI